MVLPMRMLPVRVPPMTVLPTRGRGNDSSQQGEKEGGRTHVGNERKRCGWRETGECADERNEKQRKRSAAFRSWCMPFNNMYAIPEYEAVDLAANHRPMPGTIEGGNWCPISRMHKYCSGLSLKEMPLVMASYQCGAACG